MPENFTESTAYRYGMIIGIRSTLNKFVEQTQKATESTIVIDGIPVSLQTELNILINSVNEFPTIAEAGKFFFDNQSGSVAFEWQKQQPEQISE